MPHVINSNISSLNAQRNLNTSQNALAVSLQRLSSGLRINSAKDDAAGLGISERMTTQIRGLNQATRNASDGISLAQTGEGALSEIASNLQRVRELAVQAANATNSAADRTALDLEVQQRLAEIDRVAAQTSFNGQKILDGSFGSATFQVGANVGETISVGLSTSMRYTSIGKIADYVNGSTAYSSSYNIGQQGTGVTSAALASGDLAIATGTNAAVSIGASADNSSGAGNAGRTSDSAYSKVLAINAASVPNLTAAADTTVVFDYTTLTSGAAADTYTLTINGQNIYSAAASTTITGDTMVTAINLNSGTTGVTATYDSTTARITLNAADGRDITLSQTATDADASSTLIGYGFKATNGTNNTANDALTALTAASGTAVSNVFRGSIRLTSNEAITLSGNNETYIGYADASAMALGASALNSVNVKTVSGANTAILQLDSALTSVTNLRATFGSIQNRFESVISNLTATAENVSASRSRIQDTDFAQETANLTRTQILQQAGVAMLAQANALPQNVLTLIRG